MEILVFGAVILLALSRKSSATNDTNETPVKEPGAPLPIEPPAAAKKIVDDIFAGVGTGVAVTKTVIAMGKTLAGGATSVATGSGAAVAGTLTAGASAALSVTLLVILPIIIQSAVSIVGGFQAGQKDFINAMLGLLPNARGLWQFEALLATRYPLPDGCRIWEEKDVRDVRGDISYSRYKIVTHGYRKVFRYMVDPDAQNAPSFDTVARQIRWIALRYLAERKRYAANLLNNWPIEGSRFYQQNTYNGDLTDMDLLHGYDVPVAGGTGNLGGIMQVPTITGYTEVKRLDDGTEFVTAEELRGVNTSPLEPPGADGWARFARMVALTDTLNVLYQDNSFYFPWDAAWYARDVYSRMGLSNDLATLQDAYFILPKEAWGLNNSLLLSIQKYKDNSHGKVTEI